jgi:protein gp37
MGKKTGIGWTHHTFNPWMGCNKVSAECMHCYIGGNIRRQGKEPFDGPFFTKDWKAPYEWNREAEIAGERRRVFTCSLSDFFHDGADNWRSDVWEIISDCNALDWLILTKRPELIADRLPPDWGDGYDNVWLGVTVGAESSMDRIPLLKAIPAQVRFISAEPLLERLDFRPHLDGIDWVITGCEQAKKGKRRLMDMDWVRDIDQQCRDAGVAHFFKQRYIANKGVPVHDGLLDGVVCQEWPTVEQVAS